MNLYEAAVAIHEAVRQHRSAIDEVNETLIVELSRISNALIGDQVEAKEINAKRAMP